MFVVEVGATVDVFDGACVVAGVGNRDEPGGDPTADCGRDPTCAGTKPRKFPITVPFELVCK